METDASMSVEEQLDRMDESEFKELLDACTDKSKIKTVEQAAMFSQLDRGGKSVPEVQVQLTTKQHSSSLQSLLIQNSSVPVSSNTLENTKKIHKNTTSLLHSSHHHSPRKKRGRGLTVGRFPPPESLPSSSSSCKSSGESCSRSSSEEGRSRRRSGGETETTSANSSSNSPSPTLHNSSTQYELRGDGSSIGVEGSSSSWSERHCLAESFSSLLPSPYFWNCRTGPPPSPPPSNKGWATDDLQEIIASNARPNESGRRMVRRGMSEFACDDPPSDGCDKECWGTKYARTHYSTYSPSDSEYNLPGPSSRCGYGIRSNPPMRITPIPPPPPKKKPKKNQTKEKIIPPIDYVENRFNGNIDLMVKFVLGDGTPAKPKEGKKAKKNRKRREALLTKSQSLDDDECGEEEAQNLSRSSSATSLLPKNNETSIPYYEDDMCEISEVIENVEENMENVGQIMEKIELSDSEEAKKCSYEVTPLKNEKSKKKGKNGSKSEKNLSELLKNEANNENKIEKSKSEMTVQEGKKEQKNEMSKSNEQRVEKSKNEQKVEKSKSEQKVEQTKSEQKVDKSKSEPKIEKSKVEQKVEKSKSEPKIEQTKTEQKVEKSKIEQKVDKSKSEPKIDQTKSEQKVEKSKSEQKVDKSKSEPKFEQTKSEQKVEKSKSEQKVEKSKTEQKNEKTKDEQKVEKSKTEQKNEKTKDEQKVEKTKTEQKNEKTKDEQKVEKTKTEQKNEKTKDEQKVEKTKTEQKNEKTKEEQKVEKTKTEQKNEKTKDEQKVEKSKTEQKNEKTKDEQKVEKTKTEQKNEKTKDEQKVEKCKSEQKNEKKVEKCKSEQKVEHGKNENKNEVRESKSENLVKTKDLSAPNKSKEMTSNGSSKTDNGPKNKELKNEESVSEAPSQNKNSAQVDTDGSVIADGKTIVENGEPPVVSNVRPQPTSLWSDECPFDDEDELGTKTEEDDNWTTLSSRKSAPKLDGNRRNNQQHNGFYHQTKSRTFFRSNDYRESHYENSYANHHHGHQNYHHGYNHSNQYGNHANQKYNHDNGNYGHQNHAHGAQNHAQGHQNHGNGAHNHGSHGNFNCSGVSGGGYQPQYSYNHQPSCQAYEAHGKRGYDDGSRRRGRWSQYRTPPPPQEENIPPSPTPSQQSGNNGPKKWSKVVEVNKSTTVVPELQSNDNWPSILELAPPKAQTTQNVAEKVKISDEKAKISDEKSKISDEKSKNSDEKSKISDEKAKIIAQKDDACEKDSKQDSGPKKLKISVDTKKYSDVQTEKIRILDEEIEKLNAIAREKERVKKEVENTVEFVDEKIEETKSEISDSFSDEFSERISERFQEAIEGDYYVPDDYYENVSEASYDYEENNGDFGERGEGDGEKNEKIEKFEKIAEESESRIHISICEKNNSKVVTVQQEECIPIKLAVSKSSELILNSHGILVKSTSCPPDPPSIRLPNPNPKPCVSIETQTDDKFFKRLASKLHLTKEKKDGKNEEEKDETDKNGGVEKEKAKKMEVLMKPVLNFKNAVLGIGRKKEGEKCLKMEKIGKNDGGGGGEGEGWIGIRIDQDKNPLEKYYIPSPSGHYPELSGRINEFMNSYIMVIEEKILNGASYHRV